MTLKFSGGKDMYFSIKKYLQKKYIYFLFSINSAVKTGYPYEKEKKIFDPYLTQKLIQDGGS